MQRTSRGWPSHLSGAYLDGEDVALVRDLEDLGPGEAADPQSILVDEQPRRADPDLHVTSILLLYTPNIPTG